LDFYKECRKQEIKPILGTEAYMAHDTRHERPSRRGKMDDSGGDADGGKKLYYHLTLLAENNEGYKNLIQLASRAYLEGYYYKPRGGREVLGEHSTRRLARQPRSRPPPASSRANVQAPRTKSAPIRCSPTAPASSRRRYSRPTTAT